MNSEPTSQTPWNSISESIVPDQVIKQDFRKALQSPCLSCSTSPCCTHLPLNTFQVRNLMELDHAIYLLNFDRIELGITADGNWSAYYTYPCRFLDRQSFHCTIHEQPEQPNICANYNPYSCWYKKSFTKSLTPDFLRLDRERLAHMLPLLEFDEHGNLTRIPAWDTLSEEISALPLSPGKAFEEYADDPALQQNWETKSEGSGQQTFSAKELSKPCMTCQAYCCKTLIFPQNVPVTYANLDYFKFSLGFPGIELGVSDEGWSIVLKTTCRHLKDDRCSVYGKEERPLLCQYYDEWKCTYKVHFGNPHPKDFLRLKLGHFDQLLETITFDENGHVSSLPSMREVKQYLVASSDQN
ncbi:MAG: hypothetical protein AAF399_23470 [Bacteroidota bacterium]